MRLIRSIPKFLRYASAYGWRRTIAKVAGRRRRPGWLDRLFLPLSPANPGRTVAIIGCGQAAFATLAYYLTHELGNVLLCAYDPDREAAESLARTYGLTYVADQPGKIFSDERCTHVYIASNHASHAAYTRDALSAGKVVFCEKPVVTSHADLEMLRTALQGATERFFAGYNRPFAPAVRSLLMVAPKHTPFSLICDVRGHVLPPGHWYRQPAEGTRICGNAGHWIDLFVHIYRATYGELPAHYEMDFQPTDAAVPDDNFRLTLRISTGTLFSLNMSSLQEPLLGVTETIRYEAPGTMVTINDFRSMEVISGDTRRKIRFRRKDVGHRDCTLQPFRDRGARDLTEVLFSTEIMLKAMDAALASRTKA